MADVTLHLSIEQTITLQSIVCRTGDDLDLLDLLDAAVDRFLEIEDYRDQIGRTDI